MDMKRQEEINESTNGLSLGRHSEVFLDERMKE